MRLALRTFALFFCIALSCAGVANAQTSPTLDRIRANNTIRVAYRADAPPFSTKNSLGEPSGFIVELCKAVTDQVRQQLNMPSLPITYVPVSAADSFSAMRDGRADLLCGPTTATLTRSKIVDFSIPTFVSGASLLVKGDGPKDLQSLAGRQVGVLAGTTTEEALRNTLAAGKIAATVVPLKDYNEGLAMLDNGKISALFGDRAILIYQAAQTKNAAGYSLADPLTIEPYALGLPHGDDDFRLAVNTALSHIYRSNAIGQILAGTFGQTKLPGLVQALYLVAAYPD
jgi:ABC-type amino acid transport substrate-binding protein